MNYIYLIGYMILILIYLTVSMFNQVWTECFSGQHEKLSVWGWAINPDRNVMEEGSKRFLETCKKHRVDAELIGIGYTHNRHQQQDRFYVLRDKLKGVSDDQIVVVMDAFDTLMNGSQDEILERFKKHDTRILFSAE